MNRHMTHYCPMKLLTCNECKENVLRKDMEKHTSEICPETRCKCPFHKYGCSKMVKRGDLPSHLTKNKVDHLELKVIMNILYNIYPCNPYSFVFETGYLSSAKTRITKSK